MTAISIVFAAMVTMHWATPAVLLATTFLSGGSGALAAPAWLVITPMLVPKHDLDSAIAINNASYNVSRAIGPAMAAWDCGLQHRPSILVFLRWFIAVLGALIWWRAPRRTRETLPAERLVSALRTGLRYARNNRDLDATLIRAVAFFPFGCAYWALLPLVARTRRTMDPKSTGACLAGWRRFSSWIVRAQSRRRLGPVSPGDFLHIAQLPSGSMAWRASQSSRRLRA